MNEGRILFHRLLHVEHEGEFLIFDLERAHALHSRDLVLRDDGRNVIAVVAHVAV